MIDTRLIGTPTDREGLFMALAMNISALYGRALCCFNFGTDHATITLVNHVCVAKEFISGNKGAG